MVIHKLLTISEPAKNASANGNIANLLYSDT